MLHYAATAHEAIADSDLVLHLTDWPQFRALDPHALAEVVNRRRIIDGRNSLDPDRWRLAGWSYRAVGRAASGDTDSDTDSPRPA
jgi:UDPglucose 6-dehydrogenase